VPHRTRIHTYHSGCSSRRLCPTVPSRGSLISGEAALGCGHSAGSLCVVIDRRLELLPESRDCPVSLGFRTPLDPTIIWRYMPLWKFEVLVRSSALWFAAATSFPDAFEGTKAAAEACARDRLWDRFGVSEEQRETIRGLTDWNRQFSFVNCWMMNTNESDLMWLRTLKATGSRSKAATEDCGTSFPAGSSSTRWNT